MPFTAPSWTPPLPHIPDSISLSSFMFDESYGRFPLSRSRPPFSCGLTGKSYSALEMQRRVDYLSRALCAELGFRPDSGSEWDKVVAVFSLNALDYLTLSWAMHRIGGIVTCVNAAYNAAELDYQLKDSGAKAVFTCLPLLQTCKDGVKRAGIAGDKVYILSLPGEVTEGMDGEGYKTVDELVSVGERKEEVPAADKKWSAGEGKRRCAFLCYSSGTSGLPKGVIISHYNVIANTLQIVASDSRERAELRRSSGDDFYTETCLGLLPMSHIYGLVVISHVGPHRGDGVVVLPRYDFQRLLQAIQSFRMRMLYLVPPMIIHLTKSPDVCARYDLSSVRAAFTGAAPLGAETARELVRQFPAWKVRQGYGLTETCTVVCSTPAHDVFPGSSGSLLPGMTARIVSAEGDEITGYDQPGELWVKSPSVVLGYLHNESANHETFLDVPDDDDGCGGRYMRTGDEALVRRSPATGDEHVFIVDRIKELIKVKGLQVAPAELEAHLLAHPAVADCVVIGVASDKEGEVPKAFVVRSAEACQGETDDELARSLQRHVAEHKSDHKRLRGGVEFIDVVPKSPSGKILRRMMRDQEKEKRRKESAKL